MGGPVRFFEIQLNVWLWPCRILAEIDIIRTIAILKQPFKGTELSTVTRTEYMCWNNFQHKRKRNETNAIYNAQLLVLRCYDFDVWTRKNAKKRVDWMIRIFLKSVKIKINCTSSHCKNINIWSRAKFWLTPHLLTPPPKSADLDIPIMSTIHQTVSVIYL